MAKTPSPRPFARCGAEKMIYDSRMGPQALRMGRRVVIAFHGAEGELPGHPHVVAYEIDAGEWIGPYRIGTAAGQDHHFAPVIWTDDTGALHALYNCHNRPGDHLVATNPQRLDRWQAAGPIAECITYPWVRRLSHQLTALVYRVQGHLGYTVYHTSTDGGATWGPPRSFLDFNLHPADEADAMAGTYWAYAPAADGRSLHVGFCWWDERRNIHPNYRFKRDIFSRYDLFYARLDTVTGEMTSAGGSPLPTPLNRKQAAAAMVRETYPAWTNFPTVAADTEDRPMLLVPISLDDHDPWRYRFRFLRWNGKAWTDGDLAETDNAWAASRLVSSADDTLRADVITGTGGGEECTYGGGTIERWISSDGGSTWGKSAELVPQAGLLYNNFQPVLEADGREMTGSFVTHGWSGPGGIWPAPGFETDDRNRGTGFLRLEGTWV